VKPAIKMKNKKNRIQRYIYTNYLADDFTKESGLNVFLSVNDPSTKDLKFYDTFDWRLYKNSLTLIKDNSSLYLYNLKKGQKTISLPWNIKNIPAFYEDFPNSELKNELSKYLGIRALIPLIIISENINTYQIENDDDKIVARLAFQTLKSKKLPTILLKQIILESIRGYQKEFSVIDKLLMKKGLIKSNSVPYLEALSISGIQPGSYNSKFKLIIEPGITSEEAVKQILSHLINTMKINEDGLKNDIDTEFLHDFRVAVRRARSAISQIKYIFPAKITLKLKNDFSSIGKLTNRLRDLDVYLLMKDEYTSMLPEKLRKGIEPVFNKLENERKLEQRKLKAVLSANIYKNKIKDAENCIQNIYTDEKPAKNSIVSILPLAKIFIWKKYNKVVSTGLLIEDGTPDAMLHELRIECKKLRYLLEFFSSLFPAGKMDIIISQLKKLQDNLGDFNDFYVQQINLRELLEQYSSKDTDFINISMSIGGLMAILNSRQLEARNEFKNIFPEFAKKSSREFYKKLFVGKK